MSRVFFGWVPTITGNLSFSTIGNGRNPKKLFKLAKTFENEQFVVAAQKRRVSDALFGVLGDAINVVIGRRSHTIYVFFARARYDENLMVLRGPCLEMTPVSYKGLRKLLSELQSTIDEPAFTTAFERVSEQFAKRAVGPRGSSTKIELHRNGKIRLDGDDKFLVSTPWSKPPVFQTGSL